MFILDEQLKQINKGEINKENFENVELRDGFYLVEVLDVKFSVSKAGNDMLSWTLRTLKNGIEVDEETAEFVEVPRTANRFIYHHHMLNNIQNIKKMLGDLLKFENEDGESILSRDMFQDKELIESSLELIKGQQLFILLSTTKNAIGEENQWKTFTSWSKARRLGIDTF